MGQARVIRSMVAAGNPEAGETESGAIMRTWPVALGRAAYNCLALELDVASIQDAEISLVELLDSIPDRSLIAILEGADDSLGIMILSPDILAGMIEVQTLGRVTRYALQYRRPTPTDAALVADWIDLALEIAEEVVQAEDDCHWRNGFRYASFLDDARPLGVILEDVRYGRVLTEVVLAGGAKSGTVILALPAAPEPRVALAVDEAGEAFHSRQAEFAGALSAIESELTMIVARPVLPLASVLSLAKDDVVPLGVATLDRISVVAPDGRVVGSGKLGQQQGYRAIRLNDIDRAGELQPPAPDAVSAD